MSHSKERLEKKSDSIVIRPDLKLLFLIKTSNATNILKKIKPFLRSALFLDKDN